MALELSTARAFPITSEDLRLHSLSWWFWMKAGMGFTVGCGIVYLAWTIAWLILISQVPALLFLHGFMR